MADKCWRRLNIDRLGVRQFAQHIEGWLGGLRAVNLPGPGLRNFSALVAASLPGQSNLESDSPVARRASALERH